MNSFLLNSLLLLLFSLLLFGLLYGEMISSMPPWYVDPTEHLPYGSTRSQQQQWVFDFNIAPLKREESDHYINVIEFKGQILM